jgi:hypothetical protein
MTVETFDRAKQLRSELDVIDTYEYLIRKQYSKVKNEEYNKEELLILCEKFNQTLQVLKEVKHKEFDEL